MKKGFTRVLSCLLLVQLLLCGCGDKKTKEEKLEAVSAQVLINNINVNRNALDMDIDFDIDADVTSLGKTTEILLNMFWNVQSDDDCAHVKVKLAGKDAEEAQGVEEQIYYMNYGADCMEYTSTDGENWSASSTSPKDVSSIVSIMKMDMLKDIKVENKSDEYVLTGKIDMDKTLEIINMLMGMNASETEAYKDVVINVIMKFDPNQKIKSIAISLDANTLPENGTLVVRKCDVAIVINKTSGVSVECPKEVVEKAVYQ